MPRPVQLGSSLPGGHCRSKSQIVPSYLLTSTRGFPLVTAFLNICLSLDIRKMSFLNGWSRIGLWLPTRQRRVESWRVRRLPTGPGRPPSLMSSEASCLLAFILYPVDPCSSGFSENGTVWIRHPTRLTPGVSFLVLPYGGILGSCCASTVRC